jgi:hypothetical protein
MEGLMATVVALDASLATVLRSLRGSITAARIAYPVVLPQRCGSVRVGPPE